MTTQQQTSDGPSEDELVEYMCQAAELEAAGASVEVVFGPYTALIVIGALQLASRHPELTDTLRGRYAAVVDQFRPWFAGTPGELIIDRGNDPEFDR